MARVPGSEPPSRRPIRRVHLVFKTHLDVGFTAPARDVVQRYLDDFIPRAMTLARERRAVGGERFRWTTGSWLIHTGLEVYTGERRQALEEAILAGDIVWHALPFTTHTELMDAALFRHGLGLSQALDRRFGRRTIAAKMTDVPGHTRAIVPILAEAGVQLLHIGVNPASRAPSVPDQFVWRHTDGSELVVVYDRGGYGGTRIVPGLDEVLVLAHAGDNHGPPSGSELAARYAESRAEFPGAEVAASTLDAFATALLRIKRTLPVVTQEIGDTWIHGVGTDPAKVATFCERRREGTNHNALLMVAEHTWGRDFKQALARDGQVGFAVEPTYETAPFLAKRREGAYARWEDSWREQRSYLGVEPCALEAPSPGAPTGERRFEGRQVTVEVDPDNGAVRCDGAARFMAGPPRYQLFGSEDYARFYAQYNPNPEFTGPWAVPDFTKPGLETVLRQGRVWEPRLHSLGRRTTDDGLELMLRFGFDDEPVRHYGCPAEFWLRVRLPDRDPEVRLELLWRRKQSCRIPEALWFGFHPPLSSARDLRLVKLGQEISPFDVVENGARSLHAVERVRGASWELDSLDAPLVAVGRPKLLDFDNRLPDPADGLHVNLYNNVWGTNFPMWYGEDARFRWVWRPRP